MVRSLWQVRSAGNSGGFLHGLQMLHVYVFLIAPLGAGYVAQSGTDKHERRVPVREAANYSRPPADLAVEPFQDVVRSDAWPMLGGEVGIGQRFLQAVLYFLRRLRQPQATAWPGALPPPLSPSSGRQPFCGRFILLLRCNSRKRDVPLRNSHY